MEPCWDYLGVVIQPQRFDVVPGWKKDGVATPLPNRVMGDPPWEGALFSHFFLVSLRGKSFLHI